MIEKSLKRSHKDASVRLHALFADARVEEMRVLPGDIRKVPSSDTGERNEKSPPRSYIEKKHMYGIDRLRFAVIPELLDAQEMNMNHLEPLWSVLATRSVQSRQRIVRMSLSGREQVSTKTRMALALAIVPIAYRGTSDQAKALRIWAATGFQSLVRSGEVESPLYGLDDADRLFAPSRQTGVVQKNGKDIVLLVNTHRTPFASRSSKRIAAMRQRR